MGEKRKAPEGGFAKLWWKLWDHRSFKEKQRLKSFIPLILYTFGFIYFVLYLSILNSVNRGKTGTTVKHWFGGDPPEIVKLKKEREQAIQDSFKKLYRKQVSGGL